MDTNSLFGDFNRQALILAHTALKSDDPRLMEALGLNDLEVSVRTAISNLNLSQLLMTDAFRGCLAEVRFNERQLRNYLGMTRSKEQEESLLNDSITAGIRQPQLQELKGVSRREFDVRRVRLGVPEKPRGPIEHLSEEEDLKVARAWMQTKELTDPLERYLAVHRMTEVPLDQAISSITLNGGGS
jgi:hypothetical protein